MCSQTQNTQSATLEGVSHSKNKNRLLLNCISQSPIISPFKVRKEQETDNICIMVLVWKDPNFEFLSSWNMSDYYDSPLPDVTVTEMTDERLLSLGFPVAGSSSAPSSVLDRPQPGPGSVINNPFFTFVSRKYFCPSSSPSIRQSLQLM